MKETTSILSVIIPITLMSGKFQNLATWLKDVNNYPLRVIFVHDLQDDKTGMELEKLISEKMCNDCVVLEGHFGNPGTARNFGMNSLIGDWFAFWDSDDLPCLESIFTAIKRYPTANILVGGFETEDASGEIKEFRVGKNLPNHLIANPGIWRMVFKSDLRNKFVFPPLRMAEDQIAIMEVGIFDFKIQICDSIFYRYFTSFPGQLTSNKNAKNELINAVDISRAIVRTATTENVSFAYGLYVKQTMTGIKQGSYKIKIRLLSHIFISLFSRQRISRVKWLQAFLLNIMIWRGHAEK